MVRAAVQVPSPSQCDDAVRAATEGHLRDAGGGFRAVQAHSDPKPIVDADLANAIARIAAGRDRPDLTSAYIALGVVGVLLVAAIAALAGGLMLRGRRRRLHPT